MKGRRKRIFSGDESIPLWENINNAKTITELRHALYHLCCKCQELETIVRESQAQTTTRVTHPTREITGGTGGYMGKIPIKKIIERKTWQHQ
jgi:hypothetical protein